MFKRRKEDDLPAKPDAEKVDEKHAAQEKPRPAVFGSSMQENRPVGKESMSGSDSSLAVPPFSSSSSVKDPTAMARPPIAPNPGSAPTTPTGGFRTSAFSPPRQAGRAETAERRTLVVGKGISLQGTVQDAERLVVEGTVEASMIHASELSIAVGGMFKGEVEVEEAEIAGTMDGTLTARHSLQVRATGRVIGTARCRRLQVEDGGQISGRMEMLGEASSTPAAVPERSAESAE